MNNRATTVLVLLEHRDRIVLASTYEQFKEAQLRFLDYLIETQEAELRSQRAADAFLDGSKSEERKGQVS